VSRVVDIRDLDPGAFAFVMATGIVSVAMHNDGAPAAATALLVVGLVGYVGLFACYGWRSIRWPRRLLGDLVTPRSFGFLTVAAASNVLATRLAAGGARWPALVLLAVGTAGWLLLGYAVPLALIGHPRRRPALDQVDGSWFLWVVAPQSVAVAATSVCGAAGLARLAVLATACWAIGTVLYVLVAAVALARLLLRPVQPAEMTAPYWVFMGAAAISVEAGARLLEIPHTDPPLPRAAVGGASVVLWCFATWLVPLLLGLGVWRHVLRRVSLRYETGLWSLVFPIGMYGVATHELGRTTGASWLSALGAAEGWVAAVVWATVFLAMLASVARQLRTTTCERGTGQ
jgi:tellurite resistance protein TehA-like permease